MEIMCKYTNKEKKLLTSCEIYRIKNNTKEFIGMFIDIIVIICIVWAFILGLKRGLVVQLCHLVGLYLAMLIAPRFATSIGSLIMDDPGKAYLAGFIIIVCAALLLIWIIAPFIKAIVVWEPIKGVDRMLGGLLNIATVLIITAGLFSVFNRVNISSTPTITQETLMEIVAESKDGNLEDKIMALCEADIDSDMRKYFEHKFISYETLEKSICFYPLAKFGTKAIPTVKHIDETIRSEAEKAINSQIFLNK